MVLNDRIRQRQLDPQGMLDLVLQFPRLCDDAWTRASQAPIPSIQPTAIAIIGMGGSGIGGDLVRVVGFDELAIPAVVIKGYDLPTFIGPHTMVFACSYSGNTEETLAGYEEAVRRGAACLVITSGGELLRRARAHDQLALIIPDTLPQPRAALPYLFLPILAVLTRMGVARPFDGEVREAMQVLRQVGTRHGPDAPASLCKQVAQDLLHRIPVIYSATPFLEPVAQRWKTELNENAKIFAVWNTFPELNHNETVGWGLDESLARLLYVVVLRDRYEADLVARRVTITQDLALTKASGTVDVRAVGDGKLARILSLVMMGDLVSCYLALLRGVDPTPVPAIDEFKRRLARNG